MSRDRFSDGNGERDTRAELLLSPDVMLRQALQGAVYPLSAEHLSLVARENAAPAELLTLLGALPRGMFRSVEAVEFALEGEASSRTNAQHPLASTPDSEA